MPLSLGAGQDLDALLAEGCVALPPAARQLLLGLALVGGAGRDDVQRVAGLDEDAAATGWADARRAGWLRAAADDHPMLPSAAHRRVVLANGGETAPAIAARALSAGNLAAEHAADALLVAGRPGEAAEALRGEARRASGDAARVAESAGARAGPRAAVAVVPRADRPGHGAWRAGPLSRRPGRMSAARALVTAAAESVEVAERDGVLWPAAVSCRRRAPRWNARWRAPTRPARGCCGRAWRGCS